jgi:hypothetical protein
MLVWARTVGPPYATGHDYFSSYSSTNGNPCGYLAGSETNPNGGTGYFIAPSNFLGNLSAYAGGTLSYDFKVFVGTDYFNDVDVIISGNGKSASWQSNVNPVGQGWVHFSVTLSDANFTGDSLASILSNVTELQIRGEFINNSEAEGLDNVMLTTAAVTATPLPAALPLFATGLGALGLLGWRRKRKARAAA